MKLLLLHGAGIVSSRAKLSNLKQGFTPSDIITYEQGFDLEKVRGELLTLPLIPASRLIILENPPEDLKLDLLAFDNSLTLILWFDHKVSKKGILEAAAKSGQVLLFPESKELSVFPLLDYLANQDKKGAFLELDKLKKGGFDTHYFLTMSFYLLRSLLKTPKNAPQFVQNKLSRQRRNLSRGKITSLYKDLLEIEFKIKCGLLELPQAEFLLVTKFTDPSAPEWSM